MLYNKMASEAMLRKANEKFYSANDDFKAGRYDSCISNLYYSSFQTVTALLITRGEFFNKHTHVRGYVNKELVKKGLINKDQAKLFNKLMEYRNDADYNNEVFFDKVIAEQLLHGVAAFNNSIRLLISKELQNE